MPKPQTSRLFTLPLLAVVLGSMIEEHYNRPFPFAEYLASIGEKEVRDIKVKDLVSFIYQNLEKEHEMS